MSNKKCILIGNSSNILNFEYGEGIDKFDTVVRFNRFKIRGWESKIGIKCTEWNINYGLGIKKNYLVPNFKGIKKQVKDLSCVKLVTSNRSISTDKIEYIKKEINFDFQYITPQPQWPNLHFGYKPSTGLISIFHYLDIFEQIYIHGFTLDKENGPYHYWGGKTPGDTPGRHKWAKEREIIRGLITKNKVLVYEQ